MKNQQQEIEKVVEEFKDMFCYDEEPAKITYTNCENPTDTTEKIINFISDKLTTLNQQWAEEVELVIEGCVVNGNNQGTYADGANDMKEHILKALTPTNSN